MHPPDIPENEEERLAYLKSLHILDTPEEEVYDKITRLACQVMNMPMSAISLVASDKVFLKSKVGVDACEVPRDISICGHTINSKEPLIINDTTSDVRFRDNPMVQCESGIRSYIGFPITLDNGLPIGSFCVFSNETRKISDEDLSSLEMLRDVVSKIIHEKHEAAIDPLTGIFNRRMLKMIGEKTFHRLERRKEDLSLIVIDVDHFKSINDNLGHEAGDQILIELADLIRPILRKYDYFFRIGGEEFVVFLSNTELNAATTLAEQIREAIERHDFHYKDNIIRITASFGITQHSQSDSNVNELLAKADYALYEAKKQGRNKVIQSIS